MNDLFTQADSFETLLPQMVAGTRRPSELDEETLVRVIAHLNESYRRGDPLVTDLVYDRDFIGELKARNPDHPFLLAPEPEPETAFQGDRYLHTIPMLSTDKAFDGNAVSSWVRRVRSAAVEIGLDPTTIQVDVLPKLDGLAGARYADALVTRGKNGYGVDVSRILRDGVQETLPGAVGPGEIVVVQDFFAEKIAEQYEMDHPRNFIAGICGADEVKEHHREAISAGMVRFVSYQSLDRLTVGLDTLEARWEELMDEAKKVPYLCDGAVVEVRDPALRQHMGATSHHHRWMLALKRNDEEVETEVLEVRLTTGRTGRVSPTLVVRPVYVGGATISHVTAHTARHLDEMGLGPGARVRITRSGGVIPKIQGVTLPSPNKVSMDNCPCCTAKTEREGAYVICPETSHCSAQSSAAFEHFFKTIATARGFGPSVCDALVAGGVKTIDQIYQMDAEQFVAVGISGGVAKNLVAELERSRREPLAPALMLGALGVRHLGRGDSRRLLEVIPIEELGRITPEEVMKAEGFGPLTSEPVARGVLKVWPVLSRLLAIGFNLEKPVANLQSSVAGMQVVFTGAMTSGSRDDMENRARALGAKVGGSVSGKTTLLVCGENVGASKTQKAQSLGVKIVSEAEWLTMAG